MENLSDIIEELEQPVREEEQVNWTLKKALGELGIQQRGLFNLPQAQSDLLAKANGLYVLDKRQETSQVLKELLARNPRVPQAWRLLSNLYQDDGDLLKASQALLVSCHLQRDADSWEQLGNMYLDLKNVDQAIFCFKKALSISKNLYLYWDIAQLYKQQSRIDLAIQQLELLLSKRKAVMSVVRELAKLYVEIFSYDKAIQMFQECLHMDLDNSLDPVWETLEDEQPAFSTFRIGFTELAMMGELYILQFDFDQVVLLIKQNYCRIAHLDEYMDPDDDQYEINTNMPIVLQAQLGIARLHLGQKHLAQELFDSVYQSGENCAEQMYDIAEAYISIGMYQEALQPLRALVDQEETNVEIVWEKMGIVQHHLGHFKEALEWLSMVQASDPTNVENQKRIVQVCEDMGEFQQAQKQYKTLQLLLTSVPKEQQLKRKTKRSPRDLQVQEHLKSIEKEYPRLLQMENDFLFLDPLKRLAYIRNSKRLLSHYSEVTIKSQEQEEGLTLQEWFRLFVQCALVHVRSGQTKEGLTILKNFHKPKTDTSAFRDKLNLVALGLCVFDRDAVLGTEFARSLVFDHQQTPDGYTLFLMANACTSGLAGLRLQHTHKYFKRQAASLSDANKRHVLVVEGHLALVTKNYKIAIEHYLEALKLYSEDACLWLTLSAMAYLKEYCKRSSDYEQKYNIARFFHQLELYHMAIHVYQECLSIKRYKPAAFNLAKIYMANI
ncbi:hypothetical protein EDD86DRAFT_247471 [Gorgonomyces haynaldii]|nr:hypothetical protein EDD86DRAFT_247471 [Gorgonomyces haynaldii]